MSTRLFNSDQLSISDDGALITEMGFYSNIQPTEKILAPLLPTVD